MSFDTTGDLPICYIFGAGERAVRASRAGTRAVRASRAGTAVPPACPPELERGAPELVQRADFVIAADGGLAYLQELGIAPDLVVGDFDSLGGLPPVGDYEIITLPVEKDDTDMAAAIREGLSRGYRVFRIYGGTGGRLDHTLANIACAANLARQGVRCYLHASDCVVTAIHNGSISFTEDARGIISVFSYSDISKGVTEEGLKYKLNNAIMVSTNPNGISNEFTGESSRISVKDGTLIIIYPEDT